ncbi:MAG: calycin-like domain-containing protein [Tannerella sp.]|jgi:hypothetical protein|nr:calycin-like domain-containing protein [Tannerella sp.]
MMKKYKLLSVIWLSALCTGFAACGDKEEKEDTNFAQAIAGTYLGSLRIGETESSDAQIVITRDDDRHAVLKMNETVMGLPVDIECRTDVTGDGQAYRISGNTTFYMPAEEAPVPVPVDVSGTFDRAGKTSIQIVVDVPALGSMTVIFEGQKR